MKNLLKTIYYRLVRLLPSDGVVVLMYHSVGDNNAFFTVTPSEFEKQMKYLHDDGYSVITSSLLAQVLTQKKSIPTKTVVITFDDGYLDNYTNAFPVLKKFGFPASIFVVTDVIGRARSTSNGVTLPVLTWQQIHEMASSGLVEFFPHSASHPKLDQISDHQVEDEIRQSSKILQEKLGRDMTAFAYPFGRSNQSVRDSVKRSCFRLAFGVKPGRIFNTSDPLLLPRNSIDRGVTMSMFKGIVKRGRYT